MRILVLEDAQERIELFKKLLIGHQVDFKETAESAIATLTEQEGYDMLFLDHDLGGQIYVDSGDGTGFEVAKKLVEDETIYNKNRSAFVFVHSCNYYGAGNMQALLMSKFKTLAFPFTVLMQYYSPSLGGSNG